jgi:hypothetical protein
MSQRSDTHYLGFRIAFNSELYACLYGCCLISAQFVPKVGLGHDPLGRKRQQVRIHERSDEL